MKKGIVFVIALVILLGGFFVITQVQNSISENVTASPSYSEHEEGFESEPAEETYRIGRGMGYALEELRNWQRPEGPLRVGLQVGHLDNENMPEELENLSRNGAGATAAGYNERDTVEVITRLTAELLQAENIEVDILPATVPPGYIADAFVSVHADGNNNTGVRGYKIAGPRRDYSGRSDALVAALEDAYGQETGLPKDDQITRRMTAYYAFNWPRYEHAIHPFTPAAIVETGFLTNPTDRAFLLNQADIVARGIADGILDFLSKDVSPNPIPSSLSAPSLPISGIIECAPVREDRRDREPRPCEAAIRDTEGHYYLLLFEPAIATSSLPYSATIDGVYTPVQMLDNYFWFHWEVRGLLQVSNLEKE